MVPNMTHIRLLVRDVTSSVRFYRDKLGMELSYGVEDNAYVEFQSGACTLSLFQQELMSEVTGVGNLPRSASMQDKALIYLAVDDVDAFSQTLQSRGVTLIVPPTDRPQWGLRTAHFRDPDGNLIEIGHEIPMAE